MIKDCTGTQWNWPGSGGGGYSSYCPSWSKSIAKRVNLVTFEVYKVTFKAFSLDEA